ncbi:hypothetical protein KIL84_018118 [Mauremys mutica]|uniref:Uncharacterized protein n=1 Tax=Mauremys mutica TaxID=74926 RepID=A0A9D4B9W5_9SAUR|nr:hypothetical protein KIL84_018118 [Mauremys mutica]
MRCTNYKESNHSSLTECKLGELCVLRYQLWVNQKGAGNPTVSNKKPKRRPPYFGNGRSGISVGWRTRIWGRTTRSEKSPLPALNLSQMFSFVMQWEDLV